MPASLRDSLAEANQKIATLEAEASQKWTAAEDAKKAYLESGADPTDTSSDAFKTLDAAYKEHDELADTLADAKSAREALSRMVATEGGRAAAPSSNGNGAGTWTPPEARAGLELEIGDRVVGSEEYRSLRDRGVFDSTGALGQVLLGKGWTREELKATITSGSGSAGTLIAPDRRPGILPVLMRPITVAELITVGATDSNLVQYVRQTTVTHNVGVQALEGDVKPESAYAFELVDAAVKTLAHWVPAAKQALADAGQLRTIIDGLLRAGLAQYVEDQVVKGTGAGANLRGILNTTGVAVPVVTAEESALDRIHHGITAVRLANLEPTAIGLHPLDWERVRLARDDSGAGAGTGGYLMGSPVASGATTLWGLPPAISTAFPEETALVGQYSQAVLWLREGANVLASDSHADFFVRNLVAVLAEMRGAFGVPRPDAFAKVNLGDVA